MSAESIRMKLRELEAQLRRVREQKGGNARVEDQIREEIEKYREALDYVKR